MLTPFDSSGRIDYDGLQRLTEFYIDSGASSLFANCLSSEMYELSPEERIRVTGQVIKFAGDRVPVVSTGNFPETQQEQIEFIHRLADTGVEAIILTTSMLVTSQEDDSVLRDRVYQLLDATAGIQFGFYECPEPYKRLLAPELLGDFVKTGRVIYHKDTSLDINHVREKLKHAGNSSFGLYDAYMVHAVESLQAGAAGLSCIQGNYFPELIVWICQNYANADRKNELDTVMNSIRQNMDRMHRFYPESAKYFLQERGLEIETFTRKQQEERLDNRSRQEMRQLLDELGNICQMLELDLVSG